MKILSVDQDGCSLDWCMRCAMVGHEVKLFIREAEHDSKTGRGVVGVERVTDWEKWMRWAELVFVSGNIQYIHQIQRYHDLGYPIFGATKESAFLELNREASIRALQECGIEPIPSKLFHDYDTAIRYVKSRKERLVSKPNGEADKAMTYVAPKLYPVESMTYMLERWSANPKYRQSARQHGFILQDFIPGIEMGVSGYLGPNGWSSWFTEHWEEKALMPGSMGPSTGEMGTTIRFVKKSKLATKMLLPWTETLQKIGHVGDFAVNCIIDEKGEPHFLEVTCRPGWPSWIIETALRRGDPAKWMVDLIHGQDTLECSTDIAVGLLIAQPDFPYSRLTGKMVEGIPVFGFGDWAHHHPWEMMLKDGQWQTTRDYVCVVTGTGSTVSGAKRSAVAGFKKLSIPNSPFYRNDISDRLQKQLPILQSFGFAKDMEY